MTAIEIYKAQFEEERTWYPDEWDKYTWAARKIFELTTYDSGIDERFVKDIIEVCKIILEKRNYEYIKDESNYIKYILVCQMLKQFNWIDWGTSIRGAWFGAPNRSSSKDILEYLEWGDNDGWHKIESVPFTKDNLRALIEFMEE